MKMIERRIMDPVILHLIGKWLKAGVMQNGVITNNEEGTPQGGPISPVLMSIMRIIRRHLLLLNFSKYTEGIQMGDGLCIQQKLPIVSLI
jgi:retron-type reverse transcriptase